MTATKKSTRSKSSKSNSTATGLGTVIVLAVVVVCGGLYSLLGDPLGLFATEATTVAPTDAPTLAAPVTETPTPFAPPTETAEATIPTIAPPATEAARWWQVDFVSPQRVRQADEEAYGANGLPVELLTGSITEKLIKRIDAAQTSIHIASFETDIVDVARALIRAKERGVDVRWITDDEYGIEKDGDPGHGQFQLMEAAGIEIMDDARTGLMHNKFWLFDGKTTWTGSTNITISGMFEQDNNTIVIESPELTAIYERQWQDMWSGQFGARSPSTLAQQKLNIEGSDILVLFTPEDKAITNLLPYLQGARRSIYFLAFSYTQPQLGEAMIQAASNGVIVQGVFETTGSETKFSQMTPLFCKQIPVRQDTNFAFLHHKVIIVDKRYVITGSLNFTDNANESNNENVIIIDNREIADLYVQEFERIWAVSQDPDPAKITCQ